MKMDYDSHDKELRRINDLMDYLRDVANGDSKRPVDPRLEEAADTMLQLWNALTFYGDHGNWFALSIIHDPPCGPIYYDLDPEDDRNDMNRPTHGQYARAVLCGNYDYEPPLDFTDWQERYSSHG